MTGRVFLVRHGRTALNAAGRLRSHLDPPLDEVGQGEAAAVAAELWEWRIVKILSSPLLRALQTAGAIAEAVGVSVTAVDDLIDRDYGRWAGELEAAVVARFGSLDAAPGVEPQGAVAKRSFALLEAQPPALEHGDVVLVSHEAVNRALLTHLDSALGSALSQPTGCWNEVRRNHDRWTVTLIDQQPALAMDSPEDGR
jgi:glucosyl-3-phosphoglycerate phosphatase